MVPSTKDLIVILTLIVALPACATIVRGAEASAMACVKLEEKQVDEERTRLQAKSIYVATGNEPLRVHFGFNLKASDLGESLFVILSGRLQKAVYRGPYKARISLAFDAALVADEQYDNLEFRLLNTQQRQLCVWVNERGERYWRPEAHVTIEFLNTQTVDENGLPKRFDVAIR